jgi:alpha-mannosidase
MQVISAESTELFVGPPDAPLQLARVRVSGGSEPTLVRVDGPGLVGEALAQIGRGVEECTVEVPVAVDNPIIGQRRAAQVRIAGSPETSGKSFVFTVAEPGWTMFMISHFHYDPVWWNTQGRLHQRLDRGPTRQMPANQRLRAGVCASGDGSPRT